MRKNEAHEQAQKERKADIDAVNISYKKIKDTAALQDIIKFAQSMVEYHGKIAKDGVGYKKIEDGKDPELVYFTAEKRLSELDKTAGIEEILDYIKRKIG